MEPQDNKKLALRKAISSHQEAEASLADLTQDSSDERYREMLERVRRNLSDLRAADESSGPDDLV